MRQRDKDGLEKTGTGGKFEGVHDAGVEASSQVCTIIY